MATVFREKKKICGFCWKHQEKPEKMPGFTEAFIQVRAT